MRGIQPIPLPRQSACRFGQRGAKGKVNVNGMVYSIFYSFVNHVQDSILHSGKQSRNGHRGTLLLIDDMSGRGEENAMWTWNHRRPIVLVALVLMIVVSAQRAFPDDRLQHRQVQAEVAKALAKEQRFQNLRVEGEERP